MVNWSDLPNEIKIECIQWMDLKSRLSLRATAHPEKELVERTKFHVEKYSVTKLTYESYEIDSETPRIKWTVKTCSEHIGTARDVIRLILKTHRLETFNFQCDTKLFDLFRQISRRIPLCVEQLLLDFPMPSRGDFEILKNCKGLEEFVVCFRQGNDITFDELLECDELMNTKTVCRMLNLYSITPDQTFRYVKMYLEENRANRRTRFQIYPVRQLVPKVPKFAAQVARKLRERYKSSNSLEIQVLCGDTIVISENGDVKYVCKIDNDEFVI